MPLTASVVVTVRNGRITSLPECLDRQLGTVEVVSYDGDRKPLALGDRIKPDENAPGDHVRVGD